MNNMSRYCLACLLIDIEVFLHKCLGYFGKKSCILRDIHLVVFLVLAVTSSHSFASPNYSASIQGEFEVNSVGAASYTIPIEVPPGINGMQPSISLNYSSQRGNNELGMSWALGGLSSIERCPTTLEQDGFIDGVDFDDNDKFCLDGQRLKSVAYNEYRTEIESYRKVVAYGDQYDPDYFEVKTKTGLTEYYGAYRGANDARIEAVFKIGVYETYTLSWALKRVVDPSGNYMEFNYTKNSLDGGYQIANIVYSGNEAMGFLPKAAIEFIYVDRSDVTYNYIAGSIVSLNKLASSEKSVGHFWFW